MFDNGYKSKAVCCVVKYLDYKDPAKHPTILQWIFRYCMYLQHNGLHIVVNREDFSDRKYGKLVHRLVRGVPKVPNIKNCLDIFAEYMTREPQIFPQYFIPILADLYIGCCTFRIYFQCQRYRIANKDFKLLYIF